MGTFMATVRCPGDAVGYFEQRHAYQSFERFCSGRAGCERESDSVTFHCGDSRVLVLNADSEMVEVIFQSRSNFTFMLGVDPHATTKNHYICPWKTKWI